MQRNLNLNPINNKKILITGACGTVGKELIHQLLDSGEYSPYEVIGIDNNESQLFFLENDYEHVTNARFALTDIRDRDALTSITQDIDIIFHTAAYKHVIMCERSPMEAVKTNIEGVNNIIHAALENNVSKVIFTSSDKAVNPTNVMGTSKLMGEKIITAADSTQKKRNTIFASTRFGNVLGSNGSVVDIFRNQILLKKPITLTDERMTRFIMSIQEAAKLVIKSAEIARGGEVFITKMPALSIKSLARSMIKCLVPEINPDDYKIDIIGNKPGEKLYEELMSLEETSRAIELNKYFVVLPAFRGIYKKINYTYKNIISQKVIRPYNSSSQKLLSEKQIMNFLHKCELI
jgi:FlaA1/EpsC-like NDP-sugar epimerase